MRRWWKKVKKNRKLTNTSSSADLEREASSTSESGFVDSADMESSREGTDIEDENDTRESPDDLELFEPYLDSYPPRGKQKDFVINYGWFNLKVVWLIQPDLRK